MPPAPNVPVSRCPASATRSPAGWADTMWRPKPPMVPVGPVQAVRPGRFPASPGKAEAWMPVPRFRSVAAAFASRRFEEAGWRSAEAPRLAVPRVRRKAGAFRLPPRSVRSGRERPLLAAWPRSERLSFPGTSAFAVRRSGQAQNRLSARTRRSRKANLTIVPHPLREPQIEANPDPSARRTFDEKQAPRLDPFAASNRSKLRSFRRGTLTGSELPTSIPLQPGLKANLDPSAAGRRTRGEPLVLDPSRRQRGASSVSSPPDLPPKRERFDTGPVRDID